MTPEEAARFAALRAQDERDEAEKAAARKAAAEKAEAERQERAAAEQTAAARKAAEEKAKADQVAAAERQKQREEAAVSSDVERVLRRARADYPVLDTAEGKPLLARIMERQKSLVASGMYPSQAMVQAVADHEYVLQPVVAKPYAPATDAAAQGAQAAAQATAGQPRTMNGCRWVTPIQWACDK